MTTLFRDDPLIAQELEHLRSLLEQGRGKIESLLEAAETRVESWQWATDEYFSFLPYDHELHDIARGRLIKDAPGKEKEFEYFKFGFTKTRDLIYIRAGRQSKRARTMVTFSVPEGDVNYYYRCNVVFDSDTNDALEVGLVGLELERRESAYRRLFVGLFLNKRWSATEFLYKDDIVTKVREYNSGWKFEQTYDLSHDTLGNLSAVTSEGGIVWRRPRQSLSKLLELLESELVVRIPDAISKLQIEREIYAIALAFSRATTLELVAPQIALCFEDHRRNIMRSQTRDLGMIWNPAQFDSPSTPFPHPEIDIGYGTLSEISSEVAPQLHGSVDEEKVIRALVRAAKRLNQIDWHPVLSVTDDFIVYVVDVEAPEWEGYMRGCLSKAQLKRLLLQGLLEQKA